MNDKLRALNTLRYIHGNPKAANMQQGWFYDFSNYGTYDRLTNDGITQWHPAFLALGATLDICAAAYRKFCKKYKPQPKPEKNHWGSKLLAKLRVRGKPAKVSPGQRSLWDEWDAPIEEIRNVAEKFVLANCFDPKFASMQFKIILENNTG
ncbi:hypothetical protein [Pantanalinema sp. GBBB05]|uniref:hypothetical protein n=1 Tax=Pantanalinema sp. GBBB05 TaxID=2604139 RepID=UPI003D81A09D